MLDDVLPFEIPDTHGGFSKTDGLARMEGEALVLELQTRLLGAVGTGVRSYRLSPDRLAEVRFERKLLRRRLVLRLRSLEGLGGLPGLKGGELALSIARGDADLAERLATDITLRITTQRLSELSDRVDREV